MMAAMPDRSVPEIQRMELQHTCLTAKTLLPTMLVQDVLARAMDPPATDNVALALSQLRSLGAIAEGGRDGDGDGDGHGHGHSGEEAITTLGRRLAEMPVEPSVGRMLVLSTLLRCVDPATTLAACLGSRSPFVASPLLREKSRAVQKRFSSKSDLEATMRAFEEWEQVRRARGGSAAYDWAYQNMLMVTVLNGIKQTKEQLAESMSRVYLTPKTALYDDWGRKGCVPPPRIA
jgi:HrpA-like RNA helicase